MSVSSVAWRIIAKKKCFSCQQKFCHERKCILNVAHRFVCYKKTSFQNLKKSYLIILQSDIVTSHCDLIVGDFVNVHIQWGTFHPWTTCRIGPILVGNYATRWRHINRGTSATNDAVSKKKSFDCLSYYFLISCCLKNIQKVSSYNFASEASFVSYNLEIFEFWRQKSTLESTCRTLTQKFKCWKKIAKVCWYSISFQFDNFYLNIL